MADRIVVMDQGRIVQQGRPEEVYDRPASAFIASFMGADNTIDLEISESPRGAELRIEGAANPIAWTGGPTRGRVRAHFRDDAARLVTDLSSAPDMIVLPGRIVSRAYPGGHYRYGLAVGERQFSVTDAALREPDTPIGLALPLRDIHIFPIASTDTQERKLP